MSGKKKFSLYTAIMVVVANMIGTGVFTSIGFQVAGVKSASAILLLWLIGGVISFFGAYSYAILGSFYKKNGGEYLFLKSAYSERLGFLSGWISFLLGFAAPIAAACFAFSSYFSGMLHTDMHAKFVQIPMVTIYSIVILLLITTVHSFSHKVSSLFQNVLSTVKIVILIILIGIGLFQSKNTAISFALGDHFLDNVWNKAFVFSLFFVTYSYSGWNAASYIGGEVVNPKRNVPLALIIGTGSVSILYILLNFVFLKNIPIEAMVNQIDIGVIYANTLLGSTWGRVFGGIIAFLLISSISSMVMAGPRVTNAVAKDFPKLAWFSFENKNGMPIRALWIQAGIALIFVISSTFESLITMIGFVLNLFTMLTVIGSLRVGLRIKKVSGLINRFVFPWFPIIFLLFQVWILIFGLYSKPQESCIGLLITFIGIPVYGWVKRS
jgi:APA family basic amino acid/polyamine antiporter